MKEGTSDLNQRLAERVRELRTTKGLSLEALSQQSGVSRSMISLIERGESSPTAVVLEKLAIGLGVNFTSLGTAFTLKNAWQFFMGYRFGIFNHATQALGGAVTVSRFELSTP